MASFFPFFLFAVAALAKPAAPGPTVAIASALPTVLLTAFVPFDGRAQNGSELVAREIQKSFSTRGVNYQICVLPVEYDRATVVAKGCLARLPRAPDLVLSTGEGDCGVRIETQAHNLDHAPGFPDNAGLVRENFVIEKGAPANQPLTLPARPMFMAGRSSREPKVRISTSPGNFVCNATAFRLARYFAPKKTPFGFVHLPTASCPARPKQTARILHRLVKAALANSVGNHAVN